MAKNNRTKQITFWMTEDEKAALHRLAQELDSDQSKVIRRGIRLVAQEAARRRAQQASDEELGLTF